MEKIPFTAEGLITDLAADYPERCPEPHMTDREIWMYAGARQLVRNLVSRLKQEQEEDD